MMVSVIIPTFNEGNYLGACVASLTKQSLEDFEIIIVDDGGVDNSEFIVQNLKLQNENKKIVYLKQSHKGPGAARNLGAKSARGDILVFVDADMNFERNFLKNLIKPILLGKCKGTFSKMEYVGNWENVWSRCWNINEGWEDRRRHKKGHPDTQKVFRAILRREFVRVEGFSPGGYSDDYSLSDKLGYKAINAPNSIFFHNNPQSLSEVFRQAKWASKRNYKFGALGVVLGLIRYTPPITFIVSLFKFLIKKEPRFLLFKVVYDFAAFWGIIGYHVWKNPLK